MVMYEKQRAESGQNQEVPKTGVVLWAEFENHHHFAPDRLTGWASLSTPLSAASWDSAT